MGLFQQADIGLVTVVQARFGSRRLPGKAVKPLAGQPMLAHVLRRAAAIGFPAVLATSDQPRDDALVKVGERVGVPVVRGSESDVLQRVLDAAVAARARIVMRVTGDCPLLCVDVAQEVVRLYCRTGVYAWNDTARSGWPDGLDVEVFPVGALHDAAQAATDTDEREHVTLWLRRHRPRQVAMLPCGEDWSRVKLSVDSQEDFDRVRAVQAEIGAGDYTWRGLRAALLKCGFSPAERG